MGANYNEEEGVYRSQIADKDVDGVAGDMSVMARLALDDPN